MESAAAIAQIPGAEPDAREHALLSAVVASIGEGIWIETPAGVDMNPEARRLLAVPEGAEPPRMHEVVSSSFEGHPYVYDEKPSVRASETRASVQFVQRAQRLDGVERIFSGTTSPILGHDELTGLVCVFRDVTEEETLSYVNQRLLREGFNLIPTAISVVDLEAQTVVDCNRAFCALTGLSRERVVGQAAPFSWSAEERTDVTDGRFDAVYRGDDGRPIPVELARFHVGDPGGGRGVSVTLATDLSERRELQQQLVQSGKLASIGELAAGVAHEINNPLFAILGLVEFLLREIEPGTKAHARLQLIDQTANEIKTIVHALLDFARERSDELVDVYVRDTLVQTVDLIKRTSANKGVEIECVFDDTPTLVKASPNQLKQVFLNLLSNARQAMPDGGKVTIEVQTRGDDVVTTVADTGPGIPAEVLPRIFEPFYTTKRESGGTGLGLSVSHGIATAHGGSLTVESTLGVGTTFTLRLRRLEPPQ
jgi:PAS domain S-box-containing protein